MFQFFSNNFYTLIDFLYLIQQKNYIVQEKRKKYECLIYFVLYNREIKIYNAHLFLINCSTFSGLFGIIIFM